MMFEASNDKKNSFFSSNLFLSNEDNSPSKKLGFQ
jgi:hypothetical protein